MAVQTLTRLEALAEAMSKARGRFYSPRGLDGWPEADYLAIGVLEELAFTVKGITKMETLKTWYRKGYITADDGERIPLTLVEHGDGLSNHWRWHGEEGVDTEVTGVSIADAVRSAVIAWGHGSWDLAIEGTNLEHYRRAGMAVVPTPESLKAKSFWASQQAAVALHLYKQPGALDGESDGFEDEVGEDLDGYVWTASWNPDCWVLDIEPGRTVDEAFENLVAAFPDAEILP